MLVGWVPRGIARRCCWPFFRSRLFRSRVSGRGCFSGLGFCVFLAALVAVVGVGLWVSSYPPGVFPLLRCFGDCPGGVSFILPVCGVGVPPALLALFALPVAFLSSGIGVPAVVLAFCLLLLPLPCLPFPSRRSPALLFGASSPPPPDTADPLPVLLLRFLCQLEPFLSFFSLFLPLRPAVPLGHIALPLIVVLSSLSPPYVPPLSLLPRPSPSSH